jgi:hypothetical protein
VSDLAEFVRLPEWVGPPGTCLYHYTKLSVALECIVRTQELKLSPFSLMRAPRESADWSISASGYGEELDDVHGWVEFNRKVNKLKSYFKVLSLNRDDVDAPDATIALAQGYAHPRLWEHYAENHRGVCLAFDAKTLIGRLEERLRPYGEPLSPAGQIHRRGYRARGFERAPRELRESGASAAAAEHLRQNINEFFFTKHSDWGTEREYRFVVQTETPDPVFVKVRRALRVVILGADDGSNFYEPAFARLCDPYGVDFGTCGGFMAIRTSRRARSRRFPRLPDDTVADLPSQLQKVQSFRHWCLDPP